MTNFTEIKNIIYSLGLALNVYITSQWTLRSPKAQMCTHMCSRTAFEPLRWSFLSFIMPDSRWSFSNNLVQLVPALLKMINGPIAMSNVNTRYQFTYGSAGRSSFDVVINHTSRYKIVDEDVASETIPECCRTRDKRTHNAAVIDIFW